MGASEAGRRGENLAATYLEGLGLVVMERNYRFERGEIDLVCFEPASPHSPNGTIVFVEVKARSTDRFGSPEEAVSATKRRHVTRVAEAFLYEHRLDGAPCRFDVVSVRLGGQNPVIRHIKHAFMAA